jgi:hypothetical protein
MRVGTIKMANKRDGRKSKPRRKSVGPAHPEDFGWEQHTIEAQVVTTQIDRFTEYFPNNVMADVYHVSVPGGEPIYTVSGVVRHFRDFVHMARNPDHERTANELERLAAAVFLGDNAKRNSERYAAMTMKRWIEKYGEPKQGDE